MEKIISYINNPLKIIKFLGSRGYLKWMDDVTYLRLVYKAEFGKALDIFSAKSYNEKLQWLKLFNRKQYYPSLVDKYEVRKYISQKIGNDYLIPLASPFIWENPNDICFDDLPEQFVLKCTHGSGCNIICTNKNDLNIKATRKKMSKWMRKNWFWFGREWPYKNVKPKIICEQYLEEEPGVDINNYKVMCFNGQPKLIQLIIGIFSNNPTQDFYDINWEKTTICQSGYKNSENFTPKPQSFNEMIDLSRILSEGMPHVRIDWYDIRGKLYFGEITFFDSAGFCSFDDYNDDLLLGSWIDLSEIE